MRHEPIDLVIGGYLGAGNFGDELMLRGLRRLTAEVGASGLILRARASDWMDPRPDSMLANRYSWTAARNLGRPMLLCGGTNFHDADSGQTRKRHLAAMRMLYAQLQLRALHPSAGYHLMAIGLGPILTRSTARLTRRLLARSASSTVRDPESALVAREVAGVDPRLVPDLASFAPELNSAIREPPSDVRSLAIIPVPDPCDPAGVVPSVHSVASILEAVGSCKIDVIPLHLNARNRAAARTLVEQIGQGALLTDPESSIESGRDAVRRTLDLISDRDLVVSARFHGALVARHLRCAVIGVPYHPKVSHIARQLGFPMLSPDLPGVELVNSALLSAHRPPPTAQPDALREQIAMAISP